MSSDATKHIQRELSADEHEQFRKLVYEHGLSLKEVRYKAVIEWVERQRQADPNDRAFTVLDELDSSSLLETTETDARSEGDFIKEQHGSDKTFILGDDPSTRS